MQTFQPISSIHDMILDNIHFYHFIPLSVALTVAEDHKVNRKQITYKQESRNFGVSYFTKFLICFNDISFSQPHLIFVLFVCYSKE